MNDLLPTIKKTAERKGFNTNPAEDEVSHKPENKELLNCLSRITLAQNYLKSFSANVKKLENLKIELPNAIADKEKDNSQMISLLVDKSIELQQSVKHIIDMNSEFIQTLDQSADFFEQEKRIIKNLHGSLIRQFQDVLTDFGTVESDIKNIKQIKTIRNAEIVLGRRLEGQEKENILDMLQAKLMDPASQKMRAALSDIEDRHNDLIKLEKNVNAVHQMFLQLAALVNFQGEIIDNICENISKAKQDVLVAEEDVIKSKHNMISARKKKCIIMIIALVLIVVIVLPILGVKN